MASTQPSAGFVCLSLVALTLLAGSIVKPVSAAIPRDSDLIELENSIETVERKALLALKKASDRNHEILSGWKHMNTCHWQGVSCDNSGRVTGVFVRFMGLTGQLPPEMSALKELRFLDLISNSLTGGLPKEWSTLENLEEMSLYTNSLRGPLPKEWSKLENLSYLDLDDNLIQGSLPKQWSNMKSLTYMGLENNKLSGSLPKHWSTLTNIERIFLYDNSLTGSLPKQWATMTNLEYMWLHGNSKLQAEPLEDWPENLNFNDRSDE